MANVQQKADKTKLLAYILDLVIPEFISGGYVRGESHDYKVILAFIGAHLNGNSQSVFDTLADLPLIKNFNWTPETWGYIRQNQKPLKPTEYNVTNALQNIGVEYSELEKLRSNERSINKAVTPAADDTKVHVPVSQLERIEGFLKQTYDFRNNNVAHQIEYKEKSLHEYRELNENSLHRHLQLSSERISLSNLISLLKSDFIDDFDPLQSYFTGLPAGNDTEDYIEQLANFIKARDQVAFNHHFKKMLVRCVACVFISYYYNKQAFILVGQKQNTGKSTFVRFLCPPALSKFIAENISTDKDALMCLAENFIINLDELAMLDKKEINYIKSLLSKDRIKVRRPFATRATTDTRRASFFGSTNDDDFLTDNTGSVRWLCFEIDSIDFAYSSQVNIDNIWSQAYRLYLNGFKYELTPEEVQENEKRNSKYQRLTIEYELIQQMFTPGSSSENFAFYTATNVADAVSERFPSFKQKIRRENVGKALVSLGFQKVSKRKEGQENPVYGYFVNQVP